MSAHKLIYKKVTLLFFAFNLRDDDLALEHVFISISHVELNNFCCLTMLRGPQQYQMCYEQK